MIDDYSTGHEANILKIPTSPVMPELAIARLKALLNRSNCYLEFGSGGSTMLAAEVGVPITISIESDSIWLEAVKKAVGALGGECVFYTPILDGPVLGVIRFPKPIGNSGITTPLSDGNFVKLEGFLRIWS